MDTDSILSPNSILQQANKHAISSLYVHFPFCKHLCNYCDFYKKLIQNDLDITLFEQQLEKSFQVHQKLLNQNDAYFVPLQTLYIGGGTPSLWNQNDRDGVLFLCNFLKSHNVILASDCEFTVEVNPGTLNEERIKKWKDIGVNRLSMGIQTLNPHLLKFLDRVHHVEDSLKALKSLKQSKINFSADLMLALPQSQQCRRKVLDELRQMIDYDPKHFSVYILTVKNNYKHWTGLPEESYIEEEYLQIVDFLNSQGYQQYEVSNFAIEGYCSKHNLRYWNGESVAALGPSATGLINMSGGNKGAMRYKWRNTTENFEYDLENLSQKEKSLEDLYLAMRLSSGVELSAWASDNLEKERLKLVINGWEKRGLIARQFSEFGLALNGKGFLILDGLMGELFNIFKSL